MKQRKFVMEKSKWELRCANTVDWTHVLCSICACPVKESYANISMRSEI
jgi:hypothetical protein